MARKRSHQAKLIFQVLLDAPADEAYGLEIVRASGVPAGTAYAILRRLEDEGLLDGRWEQMSPEDEGRPLRRYYRLNGEGRRVAHSETAHAQRALRLLVPGWSGR
jgi:PadR family transcriptional regulator, regulatory protein PadR